MSPGSVVAAAGVAGVAAGGVLAARRARRRTSTPQPEHQRHVLIVIQNMPLETDRRVRTEAAALRAEGWRVTVICPRGDDQPSRHALDGVEVYAYPPAPPTEGVLSFVAEFAYAWLQTARLSLAVHRERPFDVLQACNPPDTYWLLALLWRPTGVRFVFDQHDLCPEIFEAKFDGRGALHRTLLLLERASYRTADRVLSPNRSYRQVAQRRGGIPVQRISVVMSSPEPTMRRGAPDPVLRGSFTYMVCYVGIMGPQDGVDRLLDAAHHVVHVRGRRDVRFALLGYGDSLESLRHRCTELGLDDVVVFTGRVRHSEITRWLSTSDVGVTPDPPCEFNDRSTMNKTLEYMAHELPVVASDLLETRRTAEGAGCYVDTPEEMGEAIIALLEDPERRRRMGGEGRRRIEGELAWAHQRARLVAAYDSLVPPSEEHAR